MTDLSFDLDQFYSRQVALPELGQRGQDQLSRSKVAVVGLGGLGSASSLYLALAGVGYLRLIDQDTVELHNLHRQVLYSVDSILYPKVESAAQRIKDVNPNVEVDPIPENVSEENVEEIVQGVDCVVDGLDNMETRYLLNRICVKHNVPYVFGGAIGIEGNLSVFNPPETPCLECVLPGVDDNHLPTCQTRGVFGATTGIIGALQAMESVKLLAGIGDGLKGKLLICDFRDMSFTKIEIYTNPDCLACHGKTAKPGILQKHLVWLCGKKTVNLNPSQPLDLELDEIHNRIKRHFKVLLKSSLVVVFEFENVEISLFKPGRMLIKNVEDEEAALDVAKSVISKLGVNASSYFL